jgi:hypothetical protein
VSQPQFDSFGERLPDLPASPAQDRASRWMLRVGIGLFWSLVVVVITARAIYFDPQFAATFGQLAAIPSAIRAIFGV